MADETEENHLRVGLDFALYGENVTRDLVPRLIDSELLSKPLAKISGLLMWLYAGVLLGRQLRRANPVAPSAPELVAEQCRSEERIDQLRALILVAAVTKLRGLPRSGNTPS